MDRRRINRMCGAAPVVLSLLAFGVAAAAVLGGWTRGAADEGAAAHIFHLAIAAQVPFVAAFLATAGRERIGRIVAVLGLHAAALALAFAPVAVFTL